VCQDMSFYSTSRPPILCLRLFLYFPKYVSVLACNGDRPTMTTHLNHKPTLAAQTNKAIKPHTNKETPTYNATRITNLNPRISDDEKESDHDSGTSDYHKCKNTVRTDPLQLHQTAEITAEKPDSSCPWKPFLLKIHLVFEPFHCFLFPFIVSFSCLLCGS